MEKFQDSARAVADGGSEDSDILHFATLSPSPVVEVLIPFLELTHVKLQFQLTPQELAAALQHRQLLKRWHFTFRVVSSTSNDPPDGKISLEGKRTPCQSFCY